MQSLRRTCEDDLITLYPQDRIPAIKSQTLHRFMHWLYANRFTEPYQGDCGFSQLLQLYFFGHAYSITLLKNVVIDHIIEKCSVFWIPINCTKRIYRYTESGDQLRRLWVDIYAWEVPEERFQTELENGKLDKTFLQDLTLAQLHRIRALQSKTSSSIPPYEKSKSIYHKRDPGTGICCRRRQYDGEGGYHRGEIDQENANLRNKVEKLQLKLEFLKREESENTRLKRSLQKMQGKLSQAEMAVKRHRSIDHLKLFKSNNFDNPETEYSNLSRKEKVAATKQN